jgi:spore maturation protein CgeB
MGTYSDDRQPPLDTLMLQAARHWPEGKFIVAGPMYPDSIRWPANVERIVHLSPREHRAFYNAQRFTLNLTRADMRAAGFSPSVRLFEAAACATPIISDEWDGIGELFEIGEEILLSRSAEETLRYLREIPEETRRAIGEKARQRVLREHTAAHRAEELERYLVEALGSAPALGRSVPRPRGTHESGRNGNGSGTVESLTPTGEGASRNTRGRVCSPLRPTYSPENYVHTPFV